MFDLKKLLAELIGTFVLVVVAVGVATLSFGFHLAGLSTSAGVVTTALAFGLVLVALVYAIGPISGCHVNPAVTLGFVTSGRMHWLEGLGYWVAQVVGGILGVLHALGHPQRITHLFDESSGPRRRRVWQRLDHPLER